MQEGMYSLELCSRYYYVLPPSRFTFLCRSGTFFKVVNSPGISGCIDSVGLGFEAGLKKLDG